MSLSHFIRSTCPLVVLPLAALSVGCSGSSGGTSPTGTTQQFVGAVEDSNVLVGLVVTDGKALLFFCGKGDTLTTQTHWMHGSVTVGQAFSLTDGTASATGAAVAGDAVTHLSGTFQESASAKSLAWSADLATGSDLAGVYTDQLSQGLVALIVVQPTSSATPTAQGAFHVVTNVEKILQVTPLDPLALTQEGLAVDVVVSGITQKVFLASAVGD
jgi:hypothetical protein